MAPADWKNGRASAERRRKALAKRQLFYVVSRNSRAPALAETDSEFSVLPSKGQNLKVSVYLQQNVSPCPFTDKLQRNLTCASSYHVYFWL